MCLVLGGMPALAQGGATAVTATSECQGVSDGTTETVDGVVQVTGMVVRCTDTASDPRMSGTTSLTLNWQRYGRHYLYWGTRETEGPDGTWAGTFIGRSDDVNTETEGWMTHVLEGTGDYAGWTYVGTDHVLLPDGTSEGLLYEGPAPPFGPLPSAASE